MNKKIYLHEGNNISSFFPISKTRAVFDIKCGIMSFRERIERRLGKENISGLFVRDELSQLYTKQETNYKINQTDIESAEAIVIFASSYFELDVLKNIQALNKGECIIHNGKVLALCSDKITNINEIDISLFKTIEQEFIMPDGIWNIPLINGDMIIKDFDEFISFSEKEHATQSKILSDPKIKAGNFSKIWLGEKVTIEPFVNLNTDDGPIIIDNGAEVQSGSWLRGPLYIGKDSKIFSARVSGGCHIGDVCRIGGEIEESVIHGFSNKHHDGFLGHSYLGEWVNLGAMTTNSDLKNNYGEIRYQIDRGTIIESGEIKVGAFLGDHSKTGIGTLLNSGTNIGVSCNVYGGGMTPKYIPDFAWGSSQDGFVPHKIEKALNTVFIVSKRRKQTICQEMIDILYDLFKNEWKQN